MMNKIILCKIYQLHRTQANLLIASHVVHRTRKHRLQKYRSREEDRRERERGRDEERERETEFYRRVDEMYLIPLTNIRTRIERSFFSASLSFFFSCVLEIRGSLSAIKSDIPVPRVLYYFPRRGRGRGRRLARSGDGPRHRSLRFSAK